MTIASPSTPISDQIRGAVLFEESAHVREAMNARGHRFVSVDLRHRPNDPDHRTMDVFDFLASDEARDLDLIVAHPTCTYLCGSGLHWNKRVHGREACTLYALHQTRRLFEMLDGLGAAYAIENPVGIISTQIRPLSQSIQPYEYGHDASKRTCLWLKGLPKLVGTRRIAGRKVEWPRGSGKIVERWANQTDSGQNALPPSADRWSIRSETYTGIADAMAEQWTRPAQPQLEIAA